MMELCESSDRYSFFAGQREIAPDTGTEHFQGLLVLSKRARLTWLKNNVNAEAHWGAMRGTIRQALAYCTKEESRKPEYQPITWGEEPENAQGQRNDLNAVKMLIDSGASETRVAEEHFAAWVQHYRGFREYKRMKVTPRDWTTEVWIIIGPTGTGKSKMANEHSPVADTYYKQAHSDWWDGYDGQPTVVLDDFYGWLRFDDMLRLMDRYPMLVQTKGGQTNFLARTLLITSNTLPRSWYPKVSASTARFEAFYRRVTKWVFIPQQNVSIVSNSYPAFEKALEETDFGYDLVRQPAREPVV